MTESKAFAHNEAALSVLPRIVIPQLLADLTPEEQQILADEVRQVIINTVSMNGGHLAPSLGVVELSIALLTAFDPARDRIVWDVGHQAYAYKLLTGRQERFHTLRLLGGLSGFPKREESPYDHFGVGHSSTSISAALGMAMARDLRHEKSHVVAVIGDGSMTAGLAYEGLNQAGGENRNLVVVLNDNEMSISKNVGALSRFLSRNLSGRLVRRLKKDLEAVLKPFPLGADIMAAIKKGEGSVKGFFTPGMLFEAFHFNYLGPLDGHDTKGLIEAFEQVKGLEGPVLVHVLTTKGKGYTPAETNPTFFHGLGAFTPETGTLEPQAAKKATSYTEAFGHGLCELAKTDDRIVGITAAMPEGTGLACFCQSHPERFVDVGICEQHAVTLAAGLACEGFRPVVAIYSTFMQRSYDQIVHDVCLQKLPVVFCLDRAGLVGEDGPTHHGAFDISFLRHIPELTLMAPADEVELPAMLATALTLPGPSAIRYPRGTGVGLAMPQGAPEPLPVGQGRLMRPGKDAAVIGVGQVLHEALKAAETLAAEGLDIAVFNARFIKPLPADGILELAASAKRLLLVEENALQGGFGSAVLELLADNNRLDGLRIERLGLPDAFIQHGPQKILRQQLGLDAQGIAARLRALCAGW